MSKKIEKGIARTGKGWIAAEIERHDGRIVRRTLIDGPFKGTGAMPSAIRAAGTNRVVSA